MRITIWVKPGSARPGAGGEHAGALVVRVSARAVDGKATEAALAAVADAFGVRRGAVRLVSGAASRTKIVDVDAGDPQVLAALLAAPARPLGARPADDIADHAADSSGERRVVSITGPGHGRLPDASRTAEPQYRHARVRHHDPDGLQLPLP